MAEARRHQQRPAGTLEGFAQRLDGAPVGGAVLGKFREIMIEGRVDDAIHLCRAALQAVQVVERAAMDLGTGGGQLIRSLVRAGEAEHLVAGGDQFIDDGRADPAGGSSDEYAHVISPVFAGDTYRPCLYHGKVVTLSWYKG